VILAFWERKKGRANLEAFFSTEATGRGKKKRKVGKFLS